MIEADLMRVARTNGQSVGPFSCSAAKGIPTRVDAEEIKRRRDVFLEHLALAFDVGLEVAAREAQQDKDPVDVAREALVACLHNALVIVDHGTGLGFLVFLVDEDGNELTPGALHEDFIEHLMETGRIR